MGNNNQKPKKSPREPFLKKYEPSLEEYKEINFINQGPYKDSSLKKKQKIKTIYSFERVICKYVLSFLQLNECLRLQQVSRNFKILIDNSFDIYANELVQLFFDPIEPQFFITFPNKDFKMAIEYLSTLHNQSFKSFYFNYRLFCSKNILLNFTLPKPIFYCEQPDSANYFNLALQQNQQSQSLSINMELLEQIQQSEDLTQTLFSIRLANLQNQFPKSDNSTLDNLKWIIYAYQNLASYAQEIIINLNNQQQLYFFVLLWKQYQYAIINNSDKAKFDEISALFDRLYDHPAPSITLQGIATRLWGQVVVQQLLPKLLNNFEQQLFISRSRQHLDYQLSQFFDALLDISVNEHSVKFIGTSKFPIYYQPFCSFFNMILEQTENLYSSLQNRYPYQQFKQLVEKDIELMKKTMNDWIVETALIPIAINYLKEKLKRNINLSQQVIDFSSSDEEEEEKFIDEGLPQIVEMGLDNYLLQRQLAKMGDPLELAIRQLLLEDDLNQKKFEQVVESSQINQFVQSNESTRNSNLSTLVDRQSIGITQKGQNQRNLKQIKNSLRKSQIWYDFKQLKLWEAKNMIEIESRNQKYIQKQMKVDLPNQVQSLYDMCRTVKYQDVCNLFIKRDQYDSPKQQKTQGFQHIQNFENVSIASNIMNKIM